MTTEHENFQREVRSDFMELAGTRSGIIKDIVIALVTKGLYEQAVELLFGAKEDAPFKWGDLSSNESGRQFYRWLIQGKFPNIIKGIASEHYWIISGNGSMQIKNGEYAVSVYPGETFVIKKPIAEQIMLIMFSK